MAEDNPEAVELSNEAQNELQTPQEVSAEETELKETGSVEPSPVGDTTVEDTKPQEEAPANQDSLPEEEAPVNQDKKDVPADSPPQEDATVSQDEAKDGEEAPTNQDGDEAPTNEDGEKAATNEDGEKAPTNEDGEKAPTNEDGGEAPTNQDGEEAPTNQDGEEAPTNQDGEKEAPTNQDGEEAPTNQGSEEAPTNNQDGEDVPIPQESQQETAASRDANEESPSHESCEPGEMRPVSTLEDIVEEEVVDREQLIATLREELAEQERLRSLGAQLEHRIAEYLMTKKKGEERSAHGRSGTDQENRYVQCIEDLEKLKAEMSELHEAFAIEEEELREIREDRLLQIKEAKAEFVEYQNEHALKAIHSRSGKRLTMQELDKHRTSEEAKEQQVIAVRLENIKLQNKITKLEELIKKKEQLAEGLHMIDFEQLKINNVDLNEKIEERNDDILKLRRKVTSTVQVLTHVKEKLQFLQTESVEKRSKLVEMDTIVAKSRDHLTRMKQSRDSLRMDNNRLRQRGGLVGHKTLLRDYQERKDQNEGLNCRLELLQQKHSQLSVLCEGLRRKIEQAKTIG